MTRAGARAATPLPATCTLTLYAGDLVTVNTPGGGKGDPTLRDPTALHQDILNGLVPDDRR